MLYNNRRFFETSVRQVFLSIPSNFNLKPVTIRKIPACGTIYDLKVALPDDQYAKVSFVIGALEIRAPGDTSISEPTFRVHPTPCTLEDD
ncbi:unnamed protein product [Rotaria magnacalcarata]|uniref:Uncharacterized protein n=1 Tax=Rotaria magnacalcarata TaxID=392030 RepID=A0A816ZUU8_9BILA|nr:unnamed protein product [Rotaria magnacalcarata]CAF2214790.1 unnamed protein product [Rotaria magnacalcarata]CAF3768621.1 unnamed protein product [Rotaria magnacalcarata]CAF4107500.1 unnamed protein product [Rotaria magnacalcarata]